MPLVECGTKQHTVYLQIRRWLFSFAKKSGRWVFTARKLLAHLVLHLLECLTHGGVAWIIGWYLFKATCTLAKVVRILLSQLVLAVAERLLVKLT